MVRRSAPPSSRWVANECRSVCGVAPAGTPARRRPRPQAPSEVRGAEPPSALGQEERRLGLLRRFARQQGSPALEVGRQRARGLLADRHHALPPSLSVHTHLLSVEIGIRQVEQRQLLSPQPCGIGELEDGAIAQLERRRCRDRVEERADLSLFQHAREVVSRAWGWRRGRRGSPRARRGRRGGGRRTGSMPASARPWTSWRPARTGRPRTGEGACGRGPRARAPAALAHSASWPTSAR